MALIFGAAIILFTYIPGISAKSIGLSCQKQRLTRLISDLKLSDAKTGKLSDDIDPDGFEPPPPDPESDVLTVLRTLCSGAGGVHHGAICDEGGTRTHDPLLRRQLL